ncbi:MAG TPA: FIST N-terminal domain-containing protein [Actinomycetes bacterium]
MTIAPHVAPPRWMSSGQSVDPDAHRAGAQAAAAALAGRDDAKLLVVFASDSYALPDLLRGVRGVIGEVPLIGCTTAGEIAETGPADRSVAVMALGGPGFQVSTAAAKGMSEDLRGAGANAAACHLDVGSARHSVLLLLTDGLAGDQQEVVRGAYGVLGAAVPLVGGCAGDDLKMVRTAQMHGDEILYDAVVAAAIGSDAPIGIGVSHGWHRVGEAMLVTGSRGSIVESLDDEPALDVYLRRLAAPEEAHHDRAAFTRFALTHPLGLSRRSGESVRFVADVDFETRSLVCVANVPQGGLAWFMEGDHDSVLAATDAACAEALAEVGGAAPLGFLTFDCIARRGVLGDGGIALEVERIREHCPGTPVAGFYTYGEIARTRGTTGFHNQTLVVLAMT